MKKIITFIICCMFTIMLTCCDTVENNPNIESTSQDMGVGVGQISKIEFEGHTYLVRFENRGNQGFGGICHDENCKCKKEKQKLTEENIIDNNEQTDLGEFAY